jgi:hypothetical protein
VYVIIEESGDGICNVFGPFDDYENAKEVAFIEAESTLGCTRDQLEVEEPSREGPWRVYEETQGVPSWSVAPVIDNSDGHAGLR